MASNTTPMGGLGLSAVVCGLVRDVRRALREGCDSHQREHLHGRIGQLREELGVTGGPLDGYLTALQSQLDAA